MYLQKVYNESFLQGSRFNREQPEAPTGKAICPGQTELPRSVRSQGQAFHRTLMGSWKCWQNDSWQTDVGEWSEAMQGPTDRGSKDWLEPQPKDNH